MSATIRSSSSTRCTRPRGDSLPLGIGDQHRNMRERPVALGTVLGAIGPVEHAGIAQIAVGAGEAVGELGLVHLADGRKQMLPDRADIALGVQHLIGDTGKCCIAEDRIVPDPVF